MSFDRPELPHPGHKAHEVEIDETLAEEGIDLTDGGLDGIDHPGAISAGPVPNPPRRPARPADEAAQPVDDPAHEDPAH
ncbi:hypothetical protein F1D05_24200 [Kribbella qitaiheensis]|uniref:Uncharacterized protein n=1 Tax=Kribbella qitaiheensis TaxID=1544730 RepID=A0A7G6X2H8_9ACTN|nr:hypothetical protein [Kribbella qitaiheensis]QNE20443.1 hypothetical protein F1D05_24200 [Kribbella qitaiheensis]